MKCIFLVNEGKKRYNFSMKISQINFQKKYGGMYVLTDKPGGKVVAFSRRLDKAFKEAEKRVITYHAKVSLPPMF